MNISVHSVYRDPVPPLPVDANRPKWSVMIPSYNCGRHLRVALEGVLAQDPGPADMQIEVVDDCSIDDPENVVREVGGNRVAYFRQPTNVGHILNFQTCLTRARGEIIHLLHGDDLVRPGFYKELARAFNARPNIGAAFCRPTYIDEKGLELSIAPEEQQYSGLLTDAALRLATEQKIMTPCIAVRRDVYEKLGGFDRRLKCSEDWEMWVRIAAQFPIWYEPQPLALYRIHQNSNTGRHIRNAQDMAYTRMAIDIFKSYLPIAVADEIVRKTRQIYSLSALETAYRLLKTNDWVGSWAQTKEAFRFDCSFNTVGRALRVLARGGNGLARPN
jgi:glycosyltransferase involved in cell wall biosynthesis